jgi:hypothetical protein
VLLLKKRSVLLFETRISNLIKIEKKKGGNPLKNVFTSSDEKNSRSENLVSREDAFSLKASTKRKLAEKLTARMYTRTGELSDQKKCAVIVHAYLWTEVSGD